MKTIRMIRYKFRYACAYARMFPEVPLTIAVLAFQILALMLVYL
jgi:hypothetical protein